MNINNENTERSNLTDYFYFYTDVTGENYIKLMRFLFEKSSQFTLVFRQDIFFNDALHKVLDNLSPFLIEKARQSSWSKTDLCCEDEDSPAMIYYFSSTNEALEMILKLTSSLFQWTQPNFPEDISFLYDEEYFFTTTTHEKEYMFIDRPNYRVHSEFAGELSLLELSPM